MAGLKRIADTMSAAGSKMAKPAESEAAGIKATGDAENEYLNAVKATMPSAESEPRPEGTSADRVNPMAKYGDRGAEQRIDTSTYTKPLAGTPVYDRGGVIGQQPKDVIEDPQMDTNRIYEQHHHRMRPTAHSDEPVQAAENPIVMQPQAPAVHRMQLGNTSEIPVYDQGGLIGDDPLTMEARGQT